MKLIYSLFLIVLLSSCSTSNDESETPLFDLVPSSSVLVFQSEDLTEVSNLFLENSFFQANQDLPIFEEIENQVSYFKAFNTEQKGILCFSAVGKKDIATSFIASSKDVDFKKLQSQVSERKTFTYEGKEINEFTWNQQKLYAVWFEQHLLVSNSKLIVENKVRDVVNAIHPNDALLAALKTTDNSTPNLLIQVDEFKNIYNKAFAENTYLLFSNITDWVGFDVKLDAKEVKLSGVGVRQAAIEKKLDLLQKQERLSHQIAKVVALNAIGFESYGIPDFETYLEQRKNLGYAYNNTNIDFFEAIDEVGKIHLPNQDLVVLRSDDAAKAFQNLKLIIDAEKSFRNFEIYKVNNPKMLQIYSPLVVLKQANYVTQIGDFFVFAKQIATLEDCIINHLNRANLQLQNSFKNIEEQLSSSSNVLLFTLVENWKTHMQTKSNAKFSKNIEQLSVNNYQGAGVQLNVDGDFSYITAVTLSIEEEEKTTLVKQNSRFKLDQNNLIPPQFFTNWRTQQRDVFIQNENLDLQLLDTDGNSIWNKSINEVILSPITVFDIYRNTRLQLAFATQNKIYVLDKNGNNVSPFPIPLKEKITQPLQIFDYDNNGKYRFMVCQGNKLKAYNKDGKLVKGFDFSTENSEISAHPKHFRIGRKDYLLVQEASGKLHIVDRTGKERVAYQTEEVFSGKPWFLYDGQFTSTTKNGDLIQISEEGEVSVIQKGLLPNHYINATERLLVTLSENMLQINDVEIELDYGLYTAPQIIQNQDKSWVTLTDKQAKKLYVFDEFGNLLNGFPVYANSKARFFNREVNKIRLMVEGEENSIIIYDVN